MYYKYYYKGVNIKYNIYIYIYTNLICNVRLLNS